jgi:hypothetical protein
MRGKQSAGDRQPRFGEQLGLAIVGCLFAAGAILSWRKWPDAQIDYGMQLYLPWQISRGAVLYSGAKYLVGGPLSQYFNAGLFRLFGVSLLTLVAANLVLAALWLGLLYRRFLAASDAWTATLIGSGVVLAFAFGQDTDIGNYNYVTPYCHELWHGLLLSTLAIVFWSRWLERGRWWSAAAAGFCAGLVFMTKPEVFAALMAATIAGLLVFYLRQKRSAALASPPPAPTPKSLFPSAVVFVVAGLIPILAFFLYFLSVENWRESLRAVCFAWVPLLESSAAHNPFYAWCMGLDAPARNLGAMFSQFAIIAGGVAGCAWVIRWKADWPAKRWITLIFAALLLALASGYAWSDCGRSLPLLSVVTCAVLVRNLLGAANSKETGERDRPGRSSRRPADWLAGGQRLFKRLTLLADAVSGQRPETAGGTPALPKPNESPRVVPAPARALWFPLLWSLFGLFLLGKLGLFSRIWHYGFVLAMPAFTGAVYLLFWLVPSVAEKYSVNRKAFRAIIGLFLAVGFLRLFAQAQFIYQQKTLAVGEGRDRLLVYPGNINPVNPIIHASVAWMEANTPSNATLAVLPEGALVNFLTRRANPTGYAAWIPIEMKFFGETNMVSAFQRNSPDYVVFLPRDLSEFGVKPFGQEKGFGWELVQWIHKEYEPVARLSGAADATAESGVVFKRISNGK